MTFHRATYAAALALAAIVPAAEARAQYFGRNKVQYETFDWRVLTTPHFDVHFYPAESLATADASRMAERWYARHSRTLQHTFDRRPLIFYANHPDFSQTNVIGGFIDQGTGGVTEALRSRVIMPFTGVYADNDHVLGHEMVHVFQYSLANQPNGGSSRGMNSMPLWLIEGMAEYLSIGRQDAHTAMWLRDAALRNDLPSIRQLTTDPRYFPYRYGQALWAYIGGRWGDTVIGPLYKTALRTGWDAAVVRHLGVRTDTLSAQWLAQIRADYLPLMAGRQKPGELGRRILERTGRTGEMDLSPALSPDGKRVAFFTRRGVFGIDLYVADAESGRVLRKLTGPNTDAHFDAISFISSSGGWSPDGRRLAFVVERQGDDELRIVDVQGGGTRRIHVRGVGEITGPSWSPDGNRIVFSGTRGGISDLYVADVAKGGSEKITALTHDRYADLHPAWSPDGRTIAFSTDRGDVTSFDQLTYEPTGLALLDVASGGVRVLRPMGAAKHINPQWTPDGQALYFISDAGGFQDIYRTDLAGTDVRQVTRMATGVSGITYLSPALSVASGSGRLAFTVFERGGYSLYRLDSAEARGTPVTVPQPAGGLIASRQGGVPGLTGATSADGAGTLPPIREARQNLVNLLLESPETGLPAATTTYPARGYRQRLGVEYIGSPGVGVGVGPYGAGVGGGIAAYWSDLLNNEVVGATAQVQGSIKDFGGQVFRLDQKHRWNWMTSLAHIPYLTGGASVADTAIATGSGTYQGQVIQQVLLRQYIDQASAMAQYPFSQTRRFEIGASATHVGFDYDVEQLVAVGGQVIDDRRSNPPAPPGASYGQGTAALVGDYSQFGFTSPVAGGRWRLEYAPTVGGLQFQSALADWRRYFYTGKLATFAVRGLSYARFGKDAENYRQLSPIYLGQPYFVRGYDVNSYTADECSQAIGGGSACPEIDRLIGSRIAVANAELRIPLFGSRAFGLLNLPLLPTEVSPFVDAGVAWERDSRPDLRFTREATTARIPVVSAGLSTRVNVLGYAVAELFFAYPFQRTQGGWRFGWQLMPGW